MALSGTTEHFVNAGCISGTSTYLMHGYIVAHGGTAGHLLNVFMHKWRFSNSVALSGTREPFLNAECILTPPFVTLFNTP